MLSLREVTIFTELWDVFSFFPHLSQEYDISSDFAIQFPSFTVEKHVLFRGVAARANNFHR